MPLGICPKRASGGQPGRHRPNLALELAFPLTSLLTFTWQHSSRHGRVVKQERPAKDSGKEVASLLLYTNVAALSREGLLGGSGEGGTPPNPCLGHT